MRLRLPRPTGERRSVFRATISSFFFFSFFFAFRVPFSILVPFFFFGSFSETRWEDGEWVGEGGRGGRWEVKGWEVGGEGVGGWEDKGGGVGGVVPCH